MCHLLQHLDLLYKQLIKSQNFEETEHSNIYKKHPEGFAHVSFIEQPTNQSPAAVQTLPSIPAPTATPSHPISKPSTSSKTKFNIESLSYSGDNS